jgi:hypothetical protein
VWQASKAVEAERCTPRLKELFTKAAVTPGDLTSWSAISDYENISTAFLESLRTQSVFDAAFPSMVRAPLRSRSFSVTTGIQGSVVPERSVKPISSLSLTQQLLEPKKAGAIIIISKEVMNFPGSQQLFASELTKGVVAATDANFLAGLIAAAGSSVPSGGATLAQIAVDMETLLSNVTTHASSVLFYVTTPSNLKGIVGKSNTAGAPAYPNLGPMGGEIFPGVVAIPSDSIAASTAILFDATSICANSDLITPGRSEQATLQLETSPDSPPVAGTTLLSLWQNDLISLRLERWFGYTVLRSSGVAVLTAVNY